MITLPCNIEVCEDCPDNIPGYGCTAKKCTVRDDLEAEDGCDRMREDKE